MNSLTIKGQSNLSTISSNNEDVSHLSLLLNTYSNSPSINIGVVEKLEIRNIPNYYTTIYKPLLEKVVNDGEVILTKVITNELDCSRFRKVTLNGCTIPVIIKGNCEVVMDANSLRTREILVGEFTVDDNTYNGQYYVDERGKCIKHGYGKFTYTNKDIYEGEWKNDRRDGKGTVTYTNGDKYEGKWNCDRRLIQGTMTYANGDKYEGKWIFDQRHGKGTMTYANGDKYVGGWKDSQRHGKGTMTYANGDKYEGKWKNDQR
jgi:hypothetical protein